MCVARAPPDAPAQNVTTRFVFFRIFANSHHKHSNTLVAWGTWAGLAAASWLLAFVIAEVIPFFSDMLSLMSSLFDGWFGCVRARALTLWSLPRRVLTDRPRAGSSSGAWRT
jgi:hypothetical protein